MAVSVAILTSGRIVDLVQRLFRPGSIGEVRRRSLVSGRWLGQRIPRRLTLEWRGLGLVAAAEKIAQTAGKAELRRAQNRIVGNSGLHGIVVGARPRCGSPFVEFGRAQR